MTISKPLEYNGHTYPLSKAATWTEAQAEAKSLGGNLVTIKIGFIALALCLGFGITQNANADFSDDFSAGNLDKWVLNSPTGGEFSVSDGELLQTNTSPGGLNREIVAKDGNSWSDYTLSFKARVVSGFYSVTSFDIFFRLQNQPTSSSSNYGHPGYFFQLHGGGQVNLFKIDSSGNLALIQTSSKTIVTPNYTGYQVKITAIGDTIKIYVDDVLMIDTIDSTYKSGSIGFSTVHFVGAYDDVKVIDEKPTADLKDGLVAHWSFDDCSAKDISGNGHDGTIHGTPQCVNNGKGLVLNGSSDYIEIADSPAFNSPQFSMSIWASLNKLQPNSAGGANILFNKELQYEVGIMSDSGKVGFAIGAGSWYWGITDFSPNLATPFFITLVFDGNKGMLYVNGQKYKEIIYSSNIQTNTNCLRIGKRGCWNGATIDDYFNGTVDEARIYNRALTDSEVAELYSQNTTSTPRLAKPTGLEISSFSPFTLKWNAVPDATSYRIVISKDKNFKGFIENSGNSQCDATCVTFEVPINSSTNTYSYTPSQLELNFTFPQTGINYINIRAGSNNSIQSNWGNWSFKSPKSNYLGSVIIKNTPANVINNGLFSHNDQCPTNTNWCAQPTFEFLGMVANSDIPINLINNSYIVDRIKRTVSAKNVTIKANVYNRGYADAMVDIYDSQRNWVGFQTVPGHRPETNIVGNIFDTWGTNYESFIDEYSTFDPRDSNSSEKKEINLTIPLNGYAVMSKNSDTAIANMLLNTALDIIGAKDYIPKTGVAKMKIIRLFSEEVVKSGVIALLTQLKEAREQNNETDALEISKDIATELASITFNVFVTEGDHRSQIIQIMGGNEKRYTKKLGDKAAKLFAGGLMGFAEGVATSLGVYGQWIDIAIANENKAVHFE